MLGWKRHGGYIPWDDDIDLGMLREDYEKFRAQAVTALGEAYFLQTRESDPFIPYLFTKVRINGTECITAYNERRPFHKGLWLDIFPFDAIPNDKAEQERFQAKVRRRSRVHHRVVNRQIVEPEYDAPPRDLEERWFRLFGRAHRWTFMHIPSRWTQAWYTRLATKYDAVAEVEQLHSVASFVPSYTHIRLDDLLPYRDVPFEDIVVKVPQHPEVFLKMQYGDYMELPPLHTRIGHGLLRWSGMDTERENPTTDM
jgi:lipopolysaccharide cholinephosphotransferase